MSAAKLNVVLCWHMHQPWYREGEGGEYVLPWVYLHALKDYHDMAAHLESVPGARAVVNFVPTLLLQLQDYARALGRFLREGAPLPDPSLAALVAERAPADPAQRAGLVRDCLRAEEQRLVQRFAPYARLAAVGRESLREPASLAWLAPQYFFDLATWFHLAWLGESLRRESPLVRRLLERGTGYSREDRLDLAGLIERTLTGLTGRYAALAAAGRVELSVTPYAHPIAPLLLDLRSAREARPDLALPALTGYPGGAQRLRWHLEQGLAVFQGCFGRHPCGLWPAEGALSTGVLQALGGMGLRWTASSVGVLRASDPRVAHEPVPHLSLWESGDGLPVCFFRDDELSDLIGFRYATWHADDAVADLLHRLLWLRGQVSEPDRHVAVILMDGENAWDHYPENGWYFLRGLYGRLAEHPQLRLTTFAEALDAGLTRRPLPRLRPGSWIRADLSTWIGAAAKNRAWEALAAAKDAFDRSLARGELSGERLRAAERQLAVCEGSDWCWWLGSHDGPEVVAAFDTLYRRQLRVLYGLLGLPAPTQLDQPLETAPGGAGGGGPMRPGGVAA